MYPAGLEDPEPVTRLRAIGDDDLALVPDSRKTTPTVLHVGAAETLDGVASEQLRRLRAAGWGVEIACHPDGWERRLAAEGFKVRPINLPHRGSPREAVRGVPDLVRQFRAGDVSLVHTHNAEHGVLGRHVARLLGIPSVHTWRYDPVDAAETTVQRVAYTLAEFSASRAGDAVLFQNREDMDRVTTNRLVPGSKADFIGNGIVLERFESSSRPVPAIRRDLGLADGDTMILCVARLHRRKGQATLIDAVSRLLPRYPRLRLALVGTGPNEASLRRQAEERCGSRAVFLGHREDVPDLLHAADLVCLPSAREGLPRAVLEARAAGRPIVATDVVGTREALEDQVTGLLVPYGEVARLTAALESLLVDPARAKALGVRGREQLSQADWHEDAVVGRVSGVYERLIGRGA